MSWSLPQRMFHQSMDALIDDPTVGTPRVQTRIPLRRILFLPTRWLFTSLHGLTPALIRTVSSCNPPQQCGQACGDFGCLFTGK
jgi:hypothetical protein